MSNENLIRIEKKIDLLYRMVCDLRVEGEDRLNLYKVVESAILELKPLFNFSTTEEKDLVIPTTEEIERMEDELIVLDRKLKEGDYLAKNKLDLKLKLESLNSEYIYKKRVYDLKDKLRTKFKQHTNELYRKQLCKDLYSKLGISTEYENLYWFYSDISRIKAEIDALRRGYLDTKAEENAKKKY